MFIAFDGNDGAGKSTQVDYLIDYFKEKNIRYYYFDMGGFEPTKKYLQNLKHNKYNCSVELRELLYYFEGNLFSDFYRSIEENTTVICDRWLLTYLSYGQFNGICLKELNIFLHKLIRPDLYFYLDIPVNISMERIKKYRQFDGPEIGLKNEISNDESQNIRNFVNTQEKIHNYFNEAIKILDCDVIRIDATQSKDEIRAFIKQKVQTELINKKII